MAKIAYPKQNGNDPDKFVKALAKIMPRQNGTPEGFAALAESLKRSKSLIKELEVQNV